MFENAWWMVRMFFYINWLAVVCSEVNSEKNVFLNNTGNIYFSLSSLADFLCIPNLSKYYEKVTTFIYFICPLRSYKYLNATLLKTFTFMPSIKIPSTMVVFRITF